MAHLFSDCRPAEMLRRDSSRVLAFPQNRVTHSGFHIMKLHVLAAACWLTSLAGPAFAQSEGLPDPHAPPYWDERIMRLLGEKKVGAIALDVEVGPGRKCEQIDIHIGRLVDGKWRTDTIKGSSWFFRTQTAYGGMSSLVPGDYVIGSVTCKSGNHRTFLRGPHAKFQVNLGEVVNLGTLRLDYETEGFFEMTGKMKKSIEAMKPEAKANLKERFPRAFVKAVDRRMTLIGAAEVNIKKGL
jgi:hypothetical protein